MTNKRCNHKPTARTPVAECCSSLLRADTRSLNPSSLLHRSLGCRTPGVPITHLVASLHTVPQGWTAAAAGVPPPTWSPPTWAFHHPLARLQTVPQAGRRQLTGQPFHIGRQPITNSPRSKAVALIQMNAIMHTSISGNFQVRHTHFPIRKAFTDIHRYITQYIMSSFSV